MMKKQQPRNGKIKFSDASLTLVEETVDKTTKDFKKLVFSRVIQQLKRIGWKCVIPQEKIELYGMSFAEHFRYCTKGDLKGDLEITGRCINFTMFQNINAPDRPDYEGRYQYNKEHHMPYLMRLEMERTRRKIKDYLCNVYGYEFDVKLFDGRNAKCGIDGVTALEFVQGCYETSWHFKGDLSTYTISEFNKKAKDGVIEHGSRVWFFDSKGRAQTGIAYYNINNMWWVVSGKYGVTNKSAGELYVNQPENLRVKRNKKIRRKRLEKLMSDYASALNFEKAIIVRDILEREKASGG